MTQRELEYIRVIALDSPVETLYYDSTGEIDSAQNKTLGQIIRFEYAPKEISIYEDYLCLDDTKYIRFTPVQLPCIDLNKMNSFKDALLKLKIEKIKSEIQTNIFYPRRYEDQIDSWGVHGIYIKEKDIYPRSFLELDQLLHLEYDYLPLIKDVIHLFIQVLQKRGIHVHEFPFLKVYVNGNISYEVPSYIQITNEYIIDYINNTILLTFKTKDGILKLSFNIPSTFEYTLPQIKPQLIFYGNTV